MLLMEPWSNGATFDVLNKNIKQSVLKMEFMSTYMFQQDVDPRYAVQIKTTGISKTQFEAIA